MGRHNFLRAYPFEKIGRGGGGGDGKQFRMHGELGGGDLGIHNAGEWKSLKKEKLCSTSWCMMGRGWKTIYNSGKEEGVNNTKLEFSGRGGAWVFRTWGNGFFFKKKEKFRTRVRGEGGEHETIQNLAEGVGGEIIPIQNCGGKQFRIHGKLVGEGGIPGYSEEWGSLYLKWKIDFRIWVRG